ncbi:hypothetical protein Clacol_005008 [Clathrus columnatus]|uniref:Transposase n=1 Tax=Clathrus columnatus TaxID=1419009 RepID=A0AAV5AFR3_9AGAM|nr:hypothetical protein Clacol_005008 [Clathrus columnatus]
MLHHSTHKHRRRTNDPTYELHIQSALQGLTNGKYKNLATAAHEENIAESTLRDCRKGQPSWKEQCMNCQHLTKEQEDTLYDGIPPQHIWNMDEKGIQMGGGRRNGGKKYLFLQQHRNRYHISSDNLELVTVIECVSASGIIMPPSFVLSDGPLPDLRKVDNIASVATSPSEYMKVHSHSQPEMIQKAFEKTGIYPLNSCIFTDEDYGPSQATSIITNLPDSFPAQIPSSDPAILTDAESDGSDYTMSNDMDDEDEDEDDAEEEYQSDNVIEMTEAVVPTQISNTTELEPTPPMTRTSSILSILNTIPIPKVTTICEDEA